MGIKEQLEDAKKALREIPFEMEYTDRYDITYSYFELIDDALDYIIDLEAELDHVNRQLNIQRLL